MNKFKPLVLSIFCLAFMACAQEEVKLKASALRDTIYTGESLSIRLSLEGIQSDIFNDKNQDKGILGGFFEGSEGNNNFSTLVYANPETLGENIIDPYQINMLGKVYTSNSVSVQVVKPPVQQIKLEIPKEASLGEKIKVKITGKSNRSFKAQFKENEIFKINGQSSNTQVSNGKYSTQIEYTLTLKKKGIFEINRSFFKDLPKNIKLAPVKFEVK